MASCSPGPLLRKLEEECGEPEKSQELHVAYDSTAARNNTCGCTASSREGFCSSHNKLPHLLSFSTSSCATRQQSIIHASSHLLIARAERMGGEKVCIVAVRTYCRHSALPYAAHKRDGGDVRLVGRTLQERPPMTTPGNPGLRDPRSGLIRHTQQERHLPQLHFPTSVIPPHPWGPKKHEISNLL